MISPEQHLFQTILKQQGYSLTKGRELVFALLLNQPPLSIAELYQRLDGAVDRVSLYRIIEVFERLNIVKRVQLGWKYKLELSELFSHHHHHLTCVRCGAVVVLQHHPRLEKQLEQLGLDQGFVNLSHQLELQGLCRDCACLAKTD